MRRASGPTAAASRTRTRKPEYGQVRLASLASSRTSTQASLSKDAPSASMMPTTFQRPRPNSISLPSCAPR
jgi:hypothetical protein